MSIELVPDVQLRIKHPALPSQWGDSYFKKFKILNFACSQVLLLGSLASELFLLLLYDLSFPCGYFFSASMGISMGK